MPRMEKVFQRNICKCLCMKDVLSTLMDSVPLTALTLFPLHRGCEFTKSITQLYVRSRQHNYFKFESKKLVVGKAKKKNEKVQTLMHQPFVHIRLCEHQVAPHGVCLRDSQCVIHTYAGQDHIR